MRKRVWMTVIVFSCMTLLLAQSIGGKWETYNDDGKLASIIHILKIEDGTYMGQVVSSYEKDTICAACKGELKNTLIVGLKILSGLLPKGNKYVSGRILDPTTGYVYFCIASLSSDGNSLNLRGSLDKLGILSKTVTWKRHK